MLSQVIIGSVSQAVELFPAERPVELKVDRSLRIESPVSVRDFQFMNLVSRKTDVLREIDHFFFEMIECLLPIFGIHEVLDLHLLEFARAEKEIARGDLISESL